MTDIASSRLTRRLVDSLHVEAMVLADEARSYFDGSGLGDRSEMDPTSRVIFSCEALKVTTRLMHSVAWLLAQRTRLSGEGEPSQRSVRLSPATPTDAGAVARLPAEAVRIIASSEDLYDRIGRLDQRLSVPDGTRSSPVAMLHEQLRQQF